METVLERLIAKRKVDPETGCWEFTGGRDKNNYGQMRGAGGRFSVKTPAHRLSYQEHVGEIPDGMYVLHKCDNPSCINPDHLFLGSHQDNMADMSGKRRRHGVRNHSAKLSDVDVSNIRGIIKHVTRYGVVRELARMYGVSESAMTRIKSGVTWA